MASSVSGTVQSCPVGYPTEMDECAEMDTTRVLVKVRVPHTTLSPTCDKVKAVIDGEKKILGTFSGFFLDTTQRTNIFTVGRGGARRANNKLVNKFGKPFSPSFVDLSTNQCFYVPN